jgi:hypothetical protein
MKGGLIIDGAAGRSGTMMFCNARQLSLHRINLTGYALFVIILVIDFFCDLNHLLATIVAFSSDVVAQVHFTGGRIRGQRGIL